MGERRPAADKGLPGDIRTADVALGLGRPVLDALGDELEEALEHLDAWSEAIIGAGSYPKRIAGVYNVGGSPHFWHRLDPRHRG